MIKCDYPKKDLLKAMLCIAKRERPLTRLEKKYDKKISSISENRFNKINSLLVNQGCVKQHMIFFDRPDPSTIIGPMLSSEGEGLTETGEDELRDLIQLYEEEKRTTKLANRQRRRRNRRALIWSIIGGVIVGVILYILGMN